MTQAAERAVPQAAPAEPPLTEVVRKPSHLAELWRFRQLVFLLVSRELKVRFDPFLAL